MHKLSYFCLCLWAFLLCSCGQGGKPSFVETADSVTFKYARLISIYNQADYRIVTIRNPWSPGRELNRYILLPEGSKAKDLPEGTVVRTPLKRLTVFTSVHTNLLTELGAVDRISGVCDFEYIKQPVIIERVGKGLIRNMGSALNPNVELILSGKTDGMLVSPFEKSGYGTLERTGIPLIECADYMESSALGRAEWARFFGMLVGKEREADSLFKQVEQNYLHLKSIVDQQKKRRPSVLCDCMNGAAWYVPGAASTIGKLYADAGADYLFGDKKESGSIRLSFESVYNRAHDADVWLLKYGASQDYTYQSLRKEKEQYAQFKAFKTKRIYGCNTLNVPFFDQEPFHPDLLLADVIHILYPELLPTHKSIFFTPLNE